MTDSNPYLKGVKVVTVLPMAADMLPFVQRIEKAARPQRPLQAPVWYFAHPTLVAVSAGGFGQPVGRARPVGLTSFTVDQSSGIAHGLGVTVDPECAGQGVGKMLFAAREEIYRQLGVVTSICATWEGNEAMVKIFEAAGYHACQRVPKHYDYFDPPRDGILYVRSEGGV